MLPTKHETTSGFAASLWSATAAPGPDWPTLSGETKADVAIVGGGFAGLSAAYRLAERGVDVVLLEAHEPGWGASGRNNGGCVPDLVGLAGDLRARYGADGATRIQAWVDQSAEVVRELASHFDEDDVVTFNGFLDAVHKPEAVAKLRGRYDSLKQRGLTAHWLSEQESAQYSGSPIYKFGGYLLEGAGYLHPLKFARGLAKAAAKLGARIYAHSPVQRLDKAGDTWQLTMPQGIVTADKVILAQNAYNNDLWPGMSQATVRMHPWLAATQPLSDEVFASVIPGDYLLGDSHPGPYFFRKAPQNRLTIAVMRGLSLTGGKPAAQATIDMAKKTFPQIPEIRIDYLWHGTTTLQPGELPKLVNPADGLWSVFGFGRGVTLANAMGSVVADACMGAEANSLALPVSAFQPVRFSRALEKLLPVVLLAVNGKA